MRVNSATQWLYAEAGLAGTPDAELSRGGLAREVGPLGLDGWAAHNLLLQSASPSSWTQGGGNFDGVDLGAGALIDGFQTRRFRSSQANTGGWYRSLGVLPAGDFTVRAYVARVSGTAGRFLFGTDTAGNASTEFNPSTGLFSAGPARRGAIEVPGGWEVWAIYTANGTTSYNAVWYGTQQDQFDAAQWGHMGAARQPYLPTTTTARYLPRITHDPLLDVNGQPYTLTEQYGANLTPEGDFASGAGPWSNAGSTPGWAWSSGRVEVTATAAGNRWWLRPNVLTAGRTYRITFTVSVTAGSMNVDVGNTNADFTASGSYTFFVVPTVTTMQFIARASFIGWIDNVSVQEFLGVIPSSPPRRLGLMVEGQATNIATRTQDFAAWTPTFASRQLDVAVAPDGTATADRLVEDTNANIHYAISPSWTITAGQALSFDYFFKAEGRTRGRLYVTNTSGNSGFVVNFDLTAGTATAGANVGTGTNAGVRIERWSSGWWRVNLRGTVDASSTAAQVYFYLLDASGNASYTGNGTGSMLVWQSDLVAGTVSSSPIPNPGTSGSALRVADWASPGLAVTGAALAAAFPAGWSQNTIILRFRKAYQGASTEALLALSGGTSYNTGNGMLIRCAAAGSIEAGGNLSSAQTAPGVVVLDGVTVNRVAVSWSGTTLQLSVNGGAPIVLNSFDFTGVGTTHLLRGALRVDGLQGLGQAIFHSIEFMPGQYLTGPALQALTA